MTTIEKVEIIAENMKKIIGSTLEDSKGVEVEAIHLLSIINQLIVKVITMINKIIASHQAIIVREKSLPLPSFVGEKTRGVENWVVIFRNPLLKPPYLHNSNKIHNLILFLSSLTTRVVIKNLKSQTMKSLKGKLRKISKIS